MAKMKNVSRVALHVGDQGMLAPGEARELNGKDDDVQRMIDLGLLVALTPPRRKPGPKKKVEAEVEVEEVQSEEAAGSVLWGNDSEVDA